MVRMVARRRREPRPRRHSANCIDRRVLKQYALGKRRLCNGEMQHLTGCIDCTAAVRRHYIPTRHFKPEILPFLKKMRLSKDDWEHLLMCEECRNLLFP